MPCTFLQLLNCDEWSYLNRLILEGKEEITSFKVVIQINESPKYGEKNYTSRLNRQ